MKIRQLLDIQKIVESRAIPYDILEGIEKTKYYSKSKGVHMRLGTMDITHFVRVYSNLKDTDNVSIADKLDKIRLQLTDIENAV